MTRRCREDEPGTWHHITNRALARRSFFESRDDIRFFLSGVARAVRRGQIEVHAWCVLTTHFHMLARSPSGQLSDAMRRIQNRYVRHFNRRRRRDGPLVRGRYFSKRVGSFTYRRVLVRYIDANPVAAGLCADPRQYPWGSARQYASPNPPRWLTRSWVEGWIADMAGSHHYEPDLYALVTGDLHWEKVSPLVEARLAQTSRGPDELDSLLRMAPPEVRAWLQRKARLADHTRAGLPTVAAREVRAQLAALRTERGEWTIRPSRVRRDGWTTLEAGLLRDLAGAELTTIGHGLRTSEVQAMRLHRLHRQMLRGDAEYAGRAAYAAHRILHGSIPPELVLPGSRAKL